MDHNARTDVEFSSFVVPMRFEGDWDTIPTVRVDLPESVTAHFDDALCQHVGFLLKMVVVAAWVVETSECSGDQE